MSKLCRKKRRYKDRIEAELAAERISFKGLGRQRSYPCKFCQGWHLTTQERRSSPNVL